jgi:hypothetical protein
MERIHSLLYPCILLLELVTNEHQNENVQQMQSYFEEFLQKD